MSKEHNRLIELNDLIESNLHKQAFELLCEFYEEGATAYANSKAFRLYTNGNERKSAVNLGLALTFDVLKRGELRSNPKAYLRAVIKSDLIKSAKDWLKTLGGLRGDRERPQWPGSDVLPMETYEDLKKSRIFKTLQALNTLNPDCQDRIRMKYFLKLTHDEIRAEIPGTGSRKNSRRKLSDCMKELKKRTLD